MKNKIKFITASAGSGKTYKLQEILSDYVDPKNPERIRPEGVIATTFTKKAAMELRERVHTGLIKKEFFEESVRLEGALIGTVDSVCTKIIGIFSYNSGLSPKLNVLPKDDESFYFNSALSSVLTTDVISRVEEIKARIIYTDYQTNYDWRADVRKIIDLARLNGLDKKGLNDSSEFSWFSLKQCFGKQIDGEAFEKQVLIDGKKVVADLLALPKPAKLDQDLINKLEPFLRNLKDGRLPRWDDWQSIAGAGLAKKTGEAIAQNFLFLVSGYIGHPKFHEDYHEFQKVLFTIASLALEAYQDYKSKRGLIDYTDMECQVLNLLDEPKVIKRIAEEFDLLMVDEFQDTSPIQLAIFLKLSKIIPKVVWVGDQKQSIYGFRGADPSLMEAVLNKMNADLDVETLSSSYRSRPQLVIHANELFIEAFKNVMPADQVKLNPERLENASFQSALEIWRITKSGARQSKQKSMRAIAQQIQVMLHSKKLIAKKQPDQSEALSAVNLTDIAVLCRSNDNCVEMAEYLKELGLAVLLKQVGLLALPESKLMLAALRYFVFPTDSLAIMEMMLLVDGKDNVEELIEERINLLSEEKFESYGKDHWFIKRIDEIREHNLQLSPVEVVNSFLIKLEMQRVVGFWGNGEERWQNLILFRTNAMVYEESCSLMKMGATLGGYILWLNKRDDDDMLSYGGEYSGDAITVTTWHGSKGLEWPVVILNDCAGEVRKGCFGHKVFSQGDIDLDDPLHGRLIRFWFNPFHARRTNVPFINQLNATKEAMAIVKSSVEEAARLLYVGITRARDYLIIPIDEGDEAEIFKEVLGSAGFDLPKMEGLQKLPWTSTASEVFVRKFKDIDGKPDTKPLPEEVEVLKACGGQKEFSSYVLNPSANTILTGATARLYGSYGKRLTVRAKIDDDILGNCLHDIAALTFLEREDVVRILKNYKLDAILDVDEIVHQYKQFDFFLTEKGFTNSQRELPVIAKLNGQLINGIIDLLVEEMDGYVLIDHKSYRGTDLESKAISYSGQLALYKTAIDMSEKKVKVALIHFIALGIIYQVSF